MTVITPDISRSFVDNVKLAAAPRRRRGVDDTPPVELKEQEAQSLVVGSGLIVAAENVPVQTREDLIDCTLFAQLAATGALGDSADVMAWYNAYFNTLTALGWAQSDTHFEDYDFGSKNAEAHKAIIKVLSVVLGPQAAALTIVTTVLEALQSMDENSSWIKLFDRQSKSGKSARFQVATAQIDPDGLLQTALVGFNLSARAKFTQVLFFKFRSASTKLKYAAGKATIYEAALREQRDAVKARLNAYRTEYVGQVKLPPPPGGGAVRQRGGTRAPAKKAAVSGAKMSRRLLE